MVDTSAIPQVFQCRNRNRKRNRNRATERKQGTSSHFSKAPFVHTVNQSRGRRDNYRKNRTSVPSIIPACFVPHLSTLGCRTGVLHKSTTKSLLPSPSSQTGSAVPPRSSVPSQLLNSKSLNRMKNKILNPFFSSLTGSKRSNESKSF